MSVDIDAKEASMDGFVDEIITLNIGVPSWADHAKNSALLAIHTIFRPLHYYEPLKRDDPLSLHKLAAEGKIYECKNCLGWDIKNR